MAHFILHQTFVSLVNFRQIGSLFPGALSQMLHLFKVQPKPFPPLLLPAAVRALISFYHQKTKELMAPFQLHQPSPRQLQLIVLLRPEGQQVHLL